MMNPAGPGRRGPNPCYAPRMRMRGSLVAWAGLSAVALIFCTCSSTRPCADTYASADDHFSTVELLLDSVGYGTAGWSTVVHTQIDSEFADLIDISFFEPGCSVERVRLVCEGHRHGTVNVLEVRYFAGEDCRTGEMRTLQDVHTEGTARYEYNDVSVTFVFRDFVITGQPESTTDFSYPLSITMNGGYTSSLVWGSCE